MVQMFLQSNSIIIYITLKSIAFYMNKHVDISFFDGIIEKNLEHVFLSNEKIMMSKEDPLFGKVYVSSCQIGGPSCLLLAFVEVSWNLELKHQKLDYIKK